MLPKHQFAPKGYIHHRRGFAVTTYNGRDIAYILNVRGFNNDFHLAIETVTRDGTADFRETAVFFPVIPYRINLGDQKMLDLLNAGTGFSNQAVGTDPIFNPGMTLTGTTLNKPLDFGLNTTQGNIQLNVTLDQIVYLNEYREPIVWKVCNSSTVVGPTTFTNPGGLISNFTYRTKVSRASILVKNDSDTDIIYLSVTSTVVMQGKEAEVAFYDSSSTRSSKVNSGNTKIYTYSLPVLLKLEIDRTKIEDQEYYKQRLKPVAWRYLFPLNDDRPISGSTADFTTDSWNCDLIPRRKVIDSRLFSFRSGMGGADWTAQQTYFLPVGLGCMWDSVLNEDATTPAIVSMSAIAEMGPNTNKKQQPVIWQYFSLASMANMFEKQDGGGQLYSSNHYTHISRIYGEVNQGNMLFAISENIISASTQTDFVELEYFTDSYVRSTLRISKAISACVCKSGNTFVIACDQHVVDSDDGIIVLKCPSVAQMGSWTGAARDLSILQSSSLGFTFLGRTLVVNSPIKYQFESNGTSTVYYFNSNMTEDRSMINHSWIPHAMFIRELYNATIELTISTPWYLKDLGNVEDFIFVNYRTDGQGRIAGITIPKGAASYGDDGGADTDFFRFYAENDRLKIQGFDTQILNISGTPSMGYWANPLFDIGYQDHPGVFVTFILSNCSGIFRNGTGGTGDWDVKAGGKSGGVPVDPVYTRPDILYSYDGNESLFLDSGGSGHYWATITYPSWTLEMMYGGDNIALEEGRSCSFVEYTISGIMGIHTHVYLDLENVTDGGGRSYTDPNYELLNVEYTLTINTPDLVVANGVVDITPPSPTASITPSVDVYKTISDTFTYDVTRDAETSIKNIIPLTNDVPQTPLSPYLLSGPATGTVSRTMSGLNKGDWISVKYTPLYQDSRGTPVESRRITYVKGHKYYLENVQILIDGNDKTDEIKDTSTAWLYVKPGGTIAVEIVVDIKHETFPNESYDTSLDNVYPKIAKTYMMVIPASRPPRSESAFVQGRLFTTIYEELPPNGSPPAYPNCGYTMANRIYQRWESTDALNKASGVYGAIIEKDNETLTAAVDTDGQYHIYLIVEDEFAQRSAWCITNISKDFNIPFEGK